MAAPGAEVSVGRTSTPEAPEVSPQMDWSAFGEKFTRHSGIAMLMEDLEEGVKSGALMMGGGNPAQIPEVKAELEGIFAQVQRSEGGAFSPLVEAVSNYDGPRGKAAFVEALARYFNAEFGWSVTTENVALTNGSQGSFFYLFNLLCGAPRPGSGGARKKVLLPVCPEYLGYADVGVSDDLFVTARPRIEVSEEDRSFKYRLDLQAARALLQDAGGSRGVGLICVSRPTNPTGNVLTDAEVQDLTALAKEHGVPLLIDGAYGLPFPRIQFAEDVSMPRWSEGSGLILCFSLSKLGLPGARTGVVIAPRPLAKAIVNLNGVLSLAPGSVGPTLALPLLREEGRMERLCEEKIRPWYKERALYAKSVLMEALAGERRVLCHRPEGCIFLWVWCRGLPVDSREMYRRLKARGVLVIPGHFFFPGLAGAEEWAHTGECLRVSYAGIQDRDRLALGLRTIASAVLEAYAEVPPGASQGLRAGKRALPSEAESATIDGVEAEPKALRCAIGA
uniref:Aminotransferase class I/classII large domain-containing protein n=1 Tax=Alexandrium monilatum TaxID=311494 RepID=A0A7S4QAA5_9DINO|mmetsp:Transcript_50697/g.151706  ORF Transcript_50697/g.151706 Transcript_50697/m.151706 type:complete len:506 (+) Transcript_50697:66-1583(+)